MAFKNNFIVFVVVVVIIGASFARVPRAPEEETSSTTTTTTSALRYCDRTEPCGWSVYQKNIRKEIDYYLENACACPPPKNCTQANDDISIYAFVHRCFPLDKPIQD